MKLRDLIEAFRISANDRVEPYFIGDAELTALLNEAEREAAVRARLIHESQLPDVCQIAVSAGTAEYALHPALYEIDHLALQRPGEDERRRLRLVSQEWLDANVRNWRDAAGTPEYAIQGDTSLRLVPTPDADGVLLLEGYRLPLTLMDDLDDSPEIGEFHHRHLVLWALYRAFSIPDAEFFDPERAARAELEFTRVFGARPDADLRRITREDVPHHVEAFWP